MLLVFYYYFKESWFDVFVIESCGGDWIWSKEMNVVVLFGKRGW